MTYTPALYARALLETYQDKGLPKGAVARFFGIVRKNNHIGWLPEIVQRFEDFLYSTQGITRLDVELARKSLEKSLPHIKRAFGRKAEVHASIHPELIAGTRITVNRTTTIDASLKRQLERMFNK